MIVHITGTMCVGKSYLIKHILEKTDFQPPVFDITDFYKKYKCFNSRGNLDVDRIVSVLPQYLGNELSEFFSNNPSPLYLVESSGTGWYLNSHLSCVDQSVVEIPLYKPWEVVKNQAEKRDMTEKAYAFFAHYQNVNPDKPCHLSFEDAKKILLSIINVYGED